MQSRYKVHTLNCYMKSFSCTMLECSANKLATSWPYNNNRTILQLIYSSELYYNVEIDFTGTCSHSSQGRRQQPKSGEA